MSDIKIGDHYQIVIRGKWQGLAPIPPAGITALLLRGDFVVDETDEVVVVKVEPPVETFKPGDVVRAKGDDELILLARGSYVLMSSGASYSYGTLRTTTEEAFNSRLYEKVELHEAPL